MSEFALKICQLNRHTPNRLKQIENGIIICNFDRLTLIEIREYGLIEIYLEVLKKKKGKHDRLELGSRALLPLKQIHLAQFILPKHILSYAFINIHIS